MSEFGSPLLIVDCERVRAQYRKLQQGAARRGPALRAEAAAARGGGATPWSQQGGNLDLATTGEVQLVARLGIAPERCIHTHPIKRDADIRNALHFGVRVFVADNPDEVRKFAPYAQHAQLLLRVSFRSPAPSATCPASLAAIRRTRSRSRDSPRELGLEVRGLSFHVGSQAPDAGKHVEAIEVCAKLLAAAWREKLGGCDTLDIGGGFPIGYTERGTDIGRFCAPIRAALSQLPKRVRVIAEPGRYIVGPAAIGVASVMGRAQREGHWWYYLDDGLLWLLQRPALRPCALPGRAAAQRRPALPSVLAGPPATAST